MQSAVRGRRSSSEAEISSDIDHKFYKPVVCGAFVTTYQNCELTAEVSTRRFARASLSLARTGPLHRLTRTVRRFLQSPISTGWRGGDGDIHNVTARVPSRARWLLVSIGPDGCGSCSRKFPPVAWQKRRRGLFPRVASRPGRGGADRGLSGDAHPGGDKWCLFVPAEHRSCGVVLDAPVLLTIAREITAVVDLDRRRSPPKMFEEMFEAA
jgi:hypothetical protein